MVIDRQVAMVSNLKINRNDEYVGAFIASDRIELWPTFECKKKRRKFEKAASLQCTMFLLRFAPFKRKRKANANWSVRRTFSAVCT